MYELMPVYYDYYYNNCYLGCNSAISSDAHIQLNHCKTESKHTHISEIDISVHINNNWRDEESENERELCQRMDSPVTGTGSSQIGINTPPVMCG